MSQKIICIINACIKFKFWLPQFKSATLVIIPKPNKESYNAPKFFWPIILLNMISKLIKKVISTQLQFHMTSNNFLDPNQLGSIKQQSTIDTDLYLAHIIQVGWLKQCHTSIITFNIAQFFPSLNHTFLSMCLKKVSLNSNIINFFDNYHAD